MSKKVLLVDDDADDRELFCEAFESLTPPLSCITVPDAKKGLAILNSEQDPPDLIFLDVNMPVISGWQMLSELKNHPSHRNIPVIIYSTSGHARDIDKAHDLGALCFFSKPNDFNVLRETLEVVAEHLRNDKLKSLVASSSLFLVP